jgi:acetyl-CoA carboxylase carboxyl transferase subunit beta
MQEGMLSLMQMAKISGALQQHQDPETVICRCSPIPPPGGSPPALPCWGTLSFAEPKATIGFAGRRVVEQTLREKLPDDFQTAEYLQEHGFVDLIVPRTQLKQTLAQLIRLHQPVAETVMDGRNEVVSLVVAGSHV